MKRIEAWLHSFALTYKKHKNGIKNKLKKYAIELRRESVANEYAQGIQNV